MSDQADKLRKMMKQSNLNNEEKENVNYNIFNKTKKAKVLAITSGKGGVGKTSFVVNLGISLKNLGCEVAIFDADIGLANVDIMTGISPKWNITNIIEDDKSIFDIMVDGPSGIKIISGGSGIKDLVVMDESSIAKLIDEIEELEYYVDYILIDTGAGISNLVIDFIKTSDETIIILTPDPTSLTDSYAVIKALTLFGYDRNINIVVNMVKNSIEARNTFNRLNIVTEKFLKINLNFIGYLYNSKNVINSVRLQSPYINLYPNSNVSNNIKRIALNFINNDDQDSIDDGVKESFAQRLKDFFIRKDD